MVISRGLRQSLLVLALWASPALAQTIETEVAPIADPERPTGLASIEVHGFASQGFLITTDNDYLVGDTERGSFQMSEAGINFTKELTDSLRFGIQLFAQNFSSVGNYNLTADWFYLDYRWRDWLGFRAGRLKIPMGLYNEFNDIDSARVPILLPQSVYPLQARSFLFAHTGIEVYGFARSRWAGALDYRLFLGTIFIDPALVNPANGSARLATNVPFMMGGRLIWETPLSGLRLAGSYQKIRLDAVAWVQMPAVTLTIENNSSQWIASADYTFGSLGLSAEYGRGKVDQDSSIPPNSVIDRVSERGHVMATFGFTSWLQTGAYYALLFPDVSEREGAANRQHDLAFTLRFDINAHWLIKLEGHYMAGTAGLITPLSVNPAMVEVEDRWGVFLAKTTLSF